MFWLVKVTAACAKAFMAVYTKPSRLEEAELPATTMEPKELMEDWMTTLERLNTVLCSPAGRPMSKICFSVPAWKASRRRSSRSVPFSRTSIPVTSSADTVWLMMVASATPATLMEKPMTKTRFSTTLMIPAAARQYSGRLVSPTARSSALLKLYSMVIGIPMK